MFGVVVYTGYEYLTKTQDVPTVVPADVAPTPVSSTPAKQVSGVVESKQEQVAAETSPSVKGPSLDLSGQGLTKVSGDVFNRTELVSLNLSHNNLTGALPAEVRHLKSLQRLDLSYNAFTGVPAEVGQLSDLRYLNLSHNQLTGLPYELGNLSKLEVLDLTGNTYSKADLAKIKESLPSTVRIVGE